jgi:N-acyl-D-amino-acid deacylase
MHTPVGRGWRNRFIGQAFAQPCDQSKSEYSRDEKLITLQEAIRKLSTQPASNLRLQKRGMLRVGYYADVLIFDPNHIADHATFANPRQYSTGMDNVFVNGIQVLNEGKFTGVNAGRFVKGPGYGMK